MSRVRAFSPLSFLADRFEPLGERRTHHRPAGQLCQLRIPGLDRSSFPGLPLDAPVSFPLTLTLFSETARQRRHGRRLRYPLLPRVHPFLLRPKDDLVLVASLLFSFFLPACWAVARSPSWLFLLPPPVLKIAFSRSFSARGAVESEKTRRSEKARRGDDASTTRHDCDEMLEDFPRPRTDRSDASRAYEISQVSTLSPVEH